jgi:hypothetical protein
MNSTLSHKVSINEEMDVEARVFSACFIRSMDKTGNKVFSSREVQEVAQCTFNALEQLYKKHG